MGVVIYLRTRHLRIHNTGYPFEWRALVCGHVILWSFFKSVHSIFPSLPAQKFLLHRKVLPYIFTTEMLRGQSQLSNCQELPVSPNVMMRSSIRQSEKIMLSTLKPDRRVCVYVRDNWEIYVLLYWERKSPQGWDLQMVDTSPTGLSHAHAWSWVWLSACKTWKN